MGHRETSQLALFEVNFFKIHDNTYCVKIALIIPLLQVDLEFAVEMRHHEAKSSHGAL